MLKMLLHSLGLVYKSMRGVMTNSIDRDQWLHVTSESRDLSRDSEKKAIF
jgi:hypothetical protein